MKDPRERRDASSRAGLAVIGASVAQVETALPCQSLRTQSPSRPEKKVCPGSSTQIRGEDRGEGTTAICSKSIQNSAMHKIPLTRTLSPPATDLAGLGKSIAGERGLARGVGSAAIRVMIRTAVRVLALLLVLSLPLTAQDQKPSSKPATVSPFQKNEVDIAVDKAIDYLVKQQKPTGSINDRGYDTTMTSLAIMAMASVGTQPSDPDPRGKAMNRAIAFVLQADRQDDQGYYGRKDGSRMYGHGITTLMLTEMLGMGTSDDQDKLLHERCQKAIDLILSAQREKKSVHQQGGWRYKPDSRDADLSATVWQLMALRSAKNDGMQVPASSIREAVEYLKRSYSSPLNRDGLPSSDKPGGFCYQPGRRHATYTMTAAGLLAMQVCGEYESPLVAGAADWLLEHPPRWKERFCMYGTYYYAQGMYQRGDKHAETAAKLVQEMLLDKQQGNGSWEAANGEERNAGRVYATSLAVLSLSVKYHYLPIYQK